MQQSSLIAFFDSFFWAFQSWNLGRLDRNQDPTMAIIFVQITFQDLNLLPAIQPIQEQLTTQPWALSLLPLWNHLGYRLLRFIFALVLPNFTTNQEISPSFFIFLKLLKISAPMLWKSYKRCQKKTTPLHCTPSDPKLTKAGALGGGAVPKLPNYLVSMKYCGIWML